MKVGLNEFKCPCCGKPLTRYFHGDFPKSPFYRCDNPDCKNPYEVYPYSDFIPSQCTRKGEIKE